LVVLGVLALLGAGLATALAIRRRQVVPVRARIES
jgi:hypothetical protein